MQKLPDMRKKPLSIDADKQNVQFSLAYIFEYDEDRFSRGNDRRNRFCFDVFQCGIDVSLLNSYEQTALELVNKFTMTRAARELKQILKGECRMSW